MKFAYCTLQYDWKDDHGRFHVSPQIGPPSNLHLAREASGVLNKLGDDGWELVSSYPITTEIGSKFFLIFKKCIQEKEINTNG